MNAEHKQMEYGNDKMRSRWAHLWSAQLSQSVILSLGDAVREYVREGYDCCCMVSLLRFSIISFRYLSFPQCKPVLSFFGTDESFSVCLTSWLYICVFYLKLQQHLLSSLCLVHTFHCCIEAVCFLVTVTFLDWKNAHLSCFSSQGCPVVHLIIYFYLFGFSSVSESLFPLLSWWN